MLLKEEYIASLQKKYPYIEYEDLDETYEIAKEELLLILYSSDTSQISEETEIPYPFRYKVLEAMKEIVNMGNMRNFTSYSENGWKWERPDTGLQAYANINSMGL